MQDPTKRVSKQPRFAWLTAAPYHWVAILLIVSVDQLTKLWMVRELFSPPRMIEVTGFFNLVPVWNRGISFGLFATQPEIVRLGTIALAIIVVIWLVRHFHQYPSLVRFAASGIIAGAIGNMIDRIAYGMVVDFLDFHLAGFHWPAFNVADMAISVGVFLWVCAILTGRDRLPADSTSDTTTDETGFS